ncbi:MAG: serine/threonine-protein kinase [Phycisphaerales bacterium]
MALPEGYRGVREIGQGHFAIVTECVHEPSKSRVALKRLIPRKASNSDYAKRLRREIQLTKLLSHVELVVDAIDSDAGESPYYTMPVATHNLTKEIRLKNDSLDLESRINICKTICEAIAMAHAEGILHRDISPNNVLCYHQEDGGVKFKVCDFGLGKSEEEISRMSHSSAENYGTGQYVSPEQQQRLGDATKQSDVFALGRLVSYVMTGRDPTHVAQHELSNVVRKATAYSATDRFDDAQEMMDAITRQSELVLGKGSADSILLHEFEQIGEDEEIDWAPVHQEFVNGKYTGLPYHGYLKPVTHLLSTADRREEYHEEIGDDIDRFAKRYVSECKLLWKNVGWPFSSAGRFYDVLRWLFGIVEDIEVRTACFIEVWSGVYHATEKTAYPVLQRLVREIPDDKFVQAEIAAAIADFGPASVQDDVLGVCPAGPVKNAMRRVAREAMGDEAN